MLSVIGIGPGSQAMMTMEAVEALQAAEIIVGYKTYTHLVKAFTGDKQVIKTGMCKEIERCQAAIELAQAGHNVALISSGDAGIYGMAGLVLELVSKRRFPVGLQLDGLRFAHHLPHLPDKVRDAKQHGRASQAMRTLRQFAAYDQWVMPTYPEGIHSHTV